MAKTKLSKQIVSTCTTGGEYVSFIITRWGRTRSFSLVYQIIS
jgi:hypothetical protein